MPRRLLGIGFILLVSVFARAQGESVLLQHKQYLEKVAIAKALKLDTMSVFKIQMEHYERLLLSKKTADNGWQSSMKRGEWVKLAVITRRLRQQVSKREENQEKALIDSIYKALQQGENFEKLACRYSADSNNGRFVWIPVVSMLQEWINCLDVLPKGEVSRPFYSSEGIHIVKWTERKVREVVKAKWTDETIHTQLQEIREALLASVLTRKYQTPLKYDEEDLNAFFKEHKKEYAWDLPHYRGAVIHCRNKKEAKAIKKYLKKHSMEEWPKLFERLTNNRSDAPRMECGLFQIGTNAYVDKLVFKCGSFQSPDTLPYTFVMGKKLKKGPKTYMDVKERVLSDYLDCHQNDWLEQLKKKYKVEFKEDVLKTVNNE